MYYRIPIYVATELQYKFKKIIKVDLIKLK